MYCCPFAVQKSGTDKILQCTTFQQELDSYSSSSCSSFRCRSSRDENLDCVGTNPPSMENNKTSSSSARNGREFWGKMPEPQQNNGVQQVNNLVSMKQEKKIPFFSFLPFIYLICSLIHQVQPQLEMAAAKIHRQVTQGVRRHQHHSQQRRRRRQLLL